MSSAAVIAPSSGSHHQQQPSSQHHHHTTTTTNNNTTTNNTTNNNNIIILNQEERQKLLNKRKLVIQEIFQTEKEYVNALETLDTVFINPIKQQQLLKEEDTNELFKDIQIILAVNKEVLSFIDIFIKYMEDHNYKDDIDTNTNNTTNSNTLDVNNNNSTNNCTSPSTPTSTSPINTSNQTTPNSSSTSNSSGGNKSEIEQKKRNALILAKKITPTLGDIFHLMSDYLKSYSSYCNKYELIFKMIEEKKAKKSKFRKFLERTEFTPEAYNDSIISFMIKPVQRIPRYEMLLRESIKTTPQDHSDYSRLISAAQKINGVASRVNEKIREQLCRERAIQLANQFQADQLPFELVKSSRKFIAHTIMGYISDSKGIQLRCVILYNDLILLCTSSGGNSSSSGGSTNNPAGGAATTANQSTDQMMTQFFHGSSQPTTTPPPSGVAGGGSTTGDAQTSSLEQRKKESEVFDNPKVKFHLRCAISLLSTPLVWAQSLPDGYCIENAFKIVTRDKTFVLFCDNRAIRDYWVQLINDQIDKLKKQIPTLADESLANEIMLVNSRYFYYASGAEKEKRSEMLNTQMVSSSTSGNSPRSSASSSNSPRSSPRTALDSTSSNNASNNNSTIEQQRLKIEAAIQEDHLSLIIDQIQKDVDYFDQQHSYDTDYIQMIQSLKSHPSHPLSHLHSQHRLSLSITSLNSASNGASGSALSPNNVSAVDLDYLSSAFNGSGSNSLLNALSNNTTGSNNSSSHSMGIVSNNTTNSRRSSASIKSLLFNTNSNSNSNSTTTSNNTTSSPISVPFNNNAIGSGSGSHHFGSHSLSNLYGSSSESSSIMMNTPPPNSSSSPSQSIYLSPNSNNTSSTSSHQAGHLSASLALRSNSNSSNGSNNSNNHRDRSNSLYNNTKIVIPFSQQQQRQSHSPTVLKELFHKINHDFLIQQQQNENTSTTTNSTSTSEANSPTPNGGEQSQSSFTKKLTAKMLAIKMFKKSGQKKKASSVDNTDQMLYLSDGEGEVDEPFNSHLLSYMHELTRRRIDMQYLDEFGKLLEKHARQFDPFIHDLQCGSKPQHNVDKLLLRRKASEMLSSSNQSNTTASGGDSNGAVLYNRVSVCSVNDDNDGSEISVQLPTLPTVAAVEVVSSPSSEVVEVVDNEIIDDSTTELISTTNNKDNDTSSANNGDTSDDLFSSLDNQLVKLNPNKSIPLVKEHVIEEIANTKYSTLVYNPLYGLKDLPATRRFRLQYIDEFKDWSESSVDTEYSNFLKNFQDKFGDANSVGSGMGGGGAGSPMRSSNADVGGNKGVNDNSTKRRSLFFWK